MALVLEGIKVVQTAAALAGPMAGRLLADFGADVIHIEHPVRGDIARGIRGVRDYALGVPGVRGSRVISSDINYDAENYKRNKRSITLDLFQEGGREIIYKLLEKADIFLSNFRPREVEKFKLEYETLSQLNPRLIYASLTSHGKKGPDRDLPGFETSAYFARAGIMHVLPMPDSHPQGFGDNIVGLALAYGIMIALFARERTGRGQEVDTSLFQAGVFAISNDIAGALATGQDRQRIKRENYPNPLSTSYRTKDRRWLQLAMAQPEPYWSRFCKAIEREDLEHDSRFESFEPRVNNHATLFHILEEVFRTKTLGEWKVRLNEMGLIWSPQQNLPEVVNDPQARANDFFVPFDHPTYGHIEVVANPVRFSETPATIRMPAPEFGQHTEEVLLEYGYTWEDIARFREQGIIA